jgi:hypothetical protein
MSESFSREYSGPGGQDDVGPARNNSFKAV